MTDEELETCWLEAEAEADAPESAWLLYGRKVAAATEAARTQADVQEHDYKHVPIKRVGAVRGMGEVAKYVHPRDASLIAAAPNLLAALEKINEWCCYASEEATEARLMALQQIGIHARAAIATAVPSEA